MVDMLIKLKKSSTEVRRDGVCCSTEVRRDGVCCSTEFHGGCTEFHGGWENYSTELHGGCTEVHRGARRWRVLYHMRLLSFFLLCGSLCSSEVSV